MISENKSRGNVIRGDRHFIRKSRLFSKSPNNIVLHMKNVFSNPSFCGRSPSCIVESDTLILVSIFKGIHPLCCWIFPCAFLSFRAKPYTLTSSCVMNTFQMYWFSLLALISTIILCMSMEKSSFKTRYNCQHEVSSRLY